VFNWPAAMSDHSLIGLPGEAWGLIGVGVGWGLNVITEALRRRARRKDKARDVEMQRGEELVERCHEAFRWLIEAQRLALTGQPAIPLQASVMRAVAIVEIYYQDLRSRAQALDAAAREYRDFLIEIATNDRLLGVPLTRELDARLVGLRDALMTSIGMLLTDARKAVRAKIG